MGKKMIPPQDPSRIQVIMNDKQRTIGLNVQELDRQVEEKRQLMLKANRDRLEEEEEWSTHWNYIESMFERHQDCQRKRRLEHGKALKDQMEAVKRQKHLDHGFVADGSFMQGFGTSHR